MSSTLKIKVRNMRSAAGNDIANQFEIEIGNKTYFQSYDSIIAVKSPEGITLDSNAWDYSVTTGKYRNMFLNETKRETEQKIKEGIYKLADLN